jgi:hypothetical protein
MIFTEIHEKRYTLAGKAPICNGELFKQFGYMVNTTASKVVLDGTYAAPVDTDTATKELFTEIAAIRKKGSSKFSLHRHKPGTMRNNIGEQ